MKNRESGRFWSLRPRLGATQLEVACAAASVALLFMLLAQTGSPGSVIRQASAAPAAPTAFYENPLAPPPMLPQACIKRVLALSRKQQSFDLVGVMEHDCFGVVAGSPISRTVASAPTCLRPAGWHPSYGRLTTSCLID